MKPFTYQTPPSFSSHTNCETRFERHKLIGRMFMEDIPKTSWHKYMDTIPWDDQFKCQDYTKQANKIDHKLYDVLNFCCPFTTFFEYGFEDLAIFHKNNLKFDPKTLDPLYNAKNALWARAVFEKDKPKMECLLENQIYPFDTDAAFCLISISKDISIADIVYDALIKMHEHGQKNKPYFYKKLLTKTLLLNSQSHLDLLKQKTPDAFKIENKIMTEMLSEYIFHNEMSDPKNQNFLIQFMQNNHLNQNKFLASLWSTLDSTVGITEKSKFIFSFFFNPELKQEWMAENIPVVSFRCINQDLDIFKGFFGKYGVSEYSFNVCYSKLKIESEKDKKDFLFDKLVDSFSKLEEKSILKIMNQTLEKDDLVTVVEKINHRLPSEQQLTATNGAYFTQKHKLEKCLLYLDTKEHQKNKIKFL